MSANRGTANGYKTVFESGRTRSRPRHHVPPQFEIAIGLRRYSGVKPESLKTPVRPAWVIMFG